MNAKSEPSRIVRDEELETTILELERFAREEARNVRTASRGRVFKTSPDKPSIEDQIHTRLREAMRAEILPAVSLENDDIRPVEFQHELMKKALIGLRLKTLRQYAREHKLTIGGSLEELAARIAASLHWSEGEVARLVLANEPEPRSERSYVDRIFPLTDAPDIPYVRERLEYVEGRYIRVGVARWFVFEKIEVVDDDYVTLFGSLRDYRADVTEWGDTPQVIPVARDERRIEVQLGGSPLLRVRSANSAEASGAVRALGTAAQLQPLDYVPVKAGESNPSSMAWAASETLFMLDLLTTRLPAADLSKPNLTVAKFQVANPRTAATDDDGEETRPVLRSVRFEGAHILDSTPACRLIADGRGLVDMSFTIESPLRGDGETDRFPVRVALENDHVVVMTGFGLMPAIASGVHELVLDAVREEVQNGLGDEVELNGLLARVVDRAKSTTEVEEASILDHK